MSREQPNPKRRFPAYVRFWSPSRSRSWCLPAEVVLLEIVTISAWAKVVTRVSSPLRQNYEIEVKFQTLDFWSGALLATHRVWDPLVGIPGICCFLTLKT